MELARVYGMYIMVFSVLLFGKTLSSKADNKFVDLEFPNFLFVNTGTIQMNLIFLIP